MMFNTKTREAGVERELSQVAARRYLRQQEKEETRKRQKEETTEKEGRKGKTKRRRKRDVANRQRLFDLAAEGSDAESKCDWKWLGVPPWEIQHVCTN